MRTGWQQGWVRILTTALTVCLMVLIFFLSAEDADRSNATSGIFARWFAERFTAGFAEMTAEEQQILIDNIQFVVRKSAHFLEYTALGFMIRCCLESWAGNRRERGLGPAGWALGAFYAATDEAHQLMVDGRGGTVTDVLLDSSGVLTGILIWTLIFRWLKKKGRRAG